MTTALEGSCHCGAVRLTIPRAPDYINDCNCSLCVKQGAIWGYFRPDEVTVTGAVDAYVRADLAEPCLANHRCAHCGGITHWSLLPPHPADRMGINMRLFEPGARAGIEVRAIDGRSW